LVLFSSFGAIGVELKRGVHPHQVLATSSSKRGLCHDKKSEQAGGKASTFLLIVKLTLNTDSKGVLAQENILNTTGAILTAEGAQTPSSMLIAGCRYSKIFLHFCGDCRIFCEGVKGNGNCIVKPQSANNHNMVIKLVRFIGRVGHTNGLEIQAQLIVETACQLVVASASQLIVATASANTNTKIPFTVFDRQKIFKGTRLNGLNGCQMLNSSITLITERCC
jgi:hypothetical protein